MKTATIIDEIDQLIGENDLAGHPFLVRLANGDLSHDDLCDFATQYFHQIDALPRFVGIVHSVTRDANIRRALVQLLVSLELNPPTPSDLWLQTCAALGLHSDSVRKSEATTATAACLGDFEYLCQEGTISGLTALYVYLSRLPSACAVERAAFPVHYGMETGPGMEFMDAVGFQAHTHAKLLGEVLAAAISSGESHLSEMSGHAAHSAITAINGLYSGTIDNAY